MVEYFVLAMTAFTIAPSFAALLLGRMWLLLVPLLGWPLFFLGLYMKWWGYGVGDGWEFAMTLWLLLGVFCVSAGLGIRRLIATARARRPSKP